MHQRPSSALLALWYPSDKPGALAQDVDQAAMHGDLETPHHGDEILRILQREEHGDEDEEGIEDGPWEEEEQARE